MSRPSGEGPLRPRDLGLGRLFGSVREAVIVADADTGGVVLWNPSAERTFGYSAQEALQMNVEDLVPERLKERHRRGLSHYRDTGHGRYIDSQRLLDLPAVRKDGEEISIEMSLSPIEPVSEATRGRFVLAIIRDITGRKRAEREIRRLNQELERRVSERTARLEAALAELRSSERMLRESEEQYRSLVEGVRDYAIFMLDAGGRIANWNTGAESVFGYRAEEIIGEQGDILFTPEDRRSGVPEKELATAEAEGRAEDERWHARKDGSRFWASGVVTAMRDARGNLRGFSKVARDLTERRRVEEELREQEALFRSLSASSPVGIFLTDLEGRNTYTNPRCQEICGFSFEEALGEGWTRFLHPEDRERVFREWSACAREGREYSGEFRFVNPHRGTRWVHVRSAPQAPGGGKSLRHVGTVEDITERRRAEESLREIREAERERIARDLHDDVLQDLSYAVQAIELTRISVRDAALQKELREEAGLVRTAAQGIRAAINDLRLGDEDDRPFTQLVESLVERSRQRMYDCAIRLDVGEGMPSSPLGGFGTEVLRMIQEALANARRHSGARNVLVSLRCEGDRLLAAVVDDGRGFDPDAPYGGLGLRSMRQRAAALGGELAIRSRPGAGTEVRLRAPMPGQG